MRADEIEVLRADWPVPARVRMAFTLRGGGVSRPPWDSLNLGTHVGDTPAAVAENRRRVRQALQLPAEPLWLQQVHGRGVLPDELARGEAAQGEAAQGKRGQSGARQGDAHPGGADSPPRADAVVTHLPGQVCVIQVADCLPVLLAARDGSAVGAAHAGWRGLAAGVVEAAVAAMRVAPGELLAWVGPGIGADHFEVGEEVRAAFVRAERGTARAGAAGAGAGAVGAAAEARIAGGGAMAGPAAAFLANARGRWQCDLRALVHQRLAAAGVLEVHGAPLCTFSDAGRFFSHRRGGPCGRMAALIWLQD